MKMNEMSRSEEKNYKISRFDKVYMRISCDRNTYKTVSIR